MGFVTEELGRQLNQISEFLENDIRGILLEKGHTATGELNKSIKNAVIKGSDSFVIEGSMAKQGAFVISGRKAGLKGIPISALTKWIENKKFSSGIKNTRGIAFAIQKSIIKKGIKPDDFISEAFDKKQLTIENKLNLAVEQALDLALENLVTSSKKFI